MGALYRGIDWLVGLSVAAHDLTLSQICLCAIIVYLLMIGFVRMGKKRFLGRATAFDAILVIIIGSTAARAITGNSAFFRHARRRPGADRNALADFRRGLPLAGDRALGKRHHDLVGA